MSNNLDRLVSAFRQWVENRLPWYDRDVEQAKERRSEAIRKRSIEARIRSEAVMAQARIAGRR